MIITAFQPLDPRKQANFPPLLLKLTSQTMNSSVRSFKKIVHQHFKPYLSPFINEQNLKLSSRQSQSMINDLPLYMYINPKQHTCHVLCTTQSNVVDQEEQKWKFIKNSLIYKLEKEDQLRLIPQKQAGMIDYVLEKISKKHQSFQIIINSSIVELKEGFSWSKIITDHWKSFERENQCIYMKICV